MATTLRDVAAKLNLSPSLISGVLNNKTGVWASEETRQRILDAARELGYRPHAAARALRSGKTCAVSFVFVRPRADVGEPGITNVVEALASRLGAINYDLIVKAVQDDAAMRASLQEIVQCRVCDAVVLWGREDSIAEQGQLLAESEIPFVVKGRLEDVHPTWYQVDYDHEGMLGQIVAHFRAMGRRRIAYLGFRNDEVFAARLLEGYQTAMRGVLGGPVPAGYIGPDAGDSAAVEQTVARWLDLPEAQRPEAVAIGAGNAAWQGLELGLARAGLRLGSAPGEIAAAGVSHMDVGLLFGDAYTYPQIELSTIAEAMADELLCPLLQGGRPAQHVVRLLPPLRPMRSLHLDRYGLLKPSPADHTARG